MQGTLSGSTICRMKSLEGDENPVKTVRLALKLTQEVMAREMKCSINTERRCEYDRRLPTNEAVLANFKVLATKAGYAI